MKKIYNILTLFLCVTMFMGCNKEQELFVGTDNGFTSLSVVANGVTYVAAIKGDQIELSVPSGVDLSNAEVKYELCEQSSIVPDPSTIKNWGSQMVFRVKSYSKTPREYTYSVLRSEVSKVGNVQLLTQKEVDDFAKLAITVIDGNLVIGSDSKPVQDSIITLAGLSSLKEVRYNLVLNRSFAGANLQGLDNVERCGGIYVGTIASGIVFPSKSGVFFNLPKLTSSGDIVLNSGSIKSLSLENLELASSVFISSNSLVDMKLPKIRETVGSLALENSSGSINSILPEIALPQLERVGGKLSMQWFSALSVLKLPKLAYVGGEFNITLNSGALEELALPELTTIVGDLVVEKAPSLLKLTIPKVKQVASLIYNKSSYGSYPLIELDLPSLEIIDKEIYVRDIAVEKFTLPKLTKVGGSVVFWDLKVASSIDMPLVKELGTIQLYGVSLLESFNISSLDTLAKLELIDCRKLKSVKTPAVIGNIELNYASSAECPTPLFEGLQRVDELLNFSSDYNTKQYDVRNIKEIGAIKLGGGAKDAVLNLYDVEKIGKFELSSSNLKELNAPKLSEIKELKFSYIAALSLIKIPLLKRVGIFSLSEHSQWNVSSARMTDLNAFSGITSIDKVSITLCNKLVDFSGLSGVIPTLSADNWSVSACGYNPTYQNMVDGKTTL